jgi:hypothetical protein
VFDNGITTLDLDKERARDAILLIILGWEMGKVKGRGMALSLVKVWRKLR